MSSPDPSNHVGARPASPSSDQRATQASPLQLSDSSPQQPSGVPEQGATAPLPPTAPEQKPLEAKVIQAIRKIYDPEIPVNIYDLGLIYAIYVDPEANVKVHMTLTAPACPVAETLPPQVRATVESVPEVATAEVELVWDPPWTRERMSDAAKLALDMF